VATATAASRDNAFKARLSIAESTDPILVSMLPCEPVNESSRGWLGGALSRRGRLSAQLLHVGVHEHLHQLVESDLGLPAEPFADLRRVPDEERRVARAARE
jgi:hypothetical protein